MRKTAFFLAIIMLVLWILLGFDSTIAQLIHPLYAVPKLVSGRITMNEWINLYHNQYGKEMHLSAFVIYGLAFWYLSHHLERGMDIKGSRNIAYATGLTLFSVAIFEFYWMISYAYFQNQPWVIKPQYPQMRIITQNIVFLVAGILAILHLWVEGHIFNENGDPVGRRYGFRWDWLAFILVGLSVVSAVFWWHYPYPVEHFTVRLETGEIWRNTSFFPQTLYTIDLNPSDSVNAGVWFWRGNDMVHLVNTLVKVLWTLTVAYVGAIRKVLSM